MRSRRLTSSARVVRLSAFVACLLCGAGAVQRRSLEPLQLGVVSQTPGQAGVLTALDHGFFDAEGLDVQIVPSPGGVHGIQTLLAGQVPILSGAAPPPLISAVLGGARIVWVAELLGTLPLYVVGPPDLTQPEALRGRRLGINVPGSVGAFAAVLAMRRLGLEPDRDVTLVSMGDSRIGLAALDAGQIDATIVPPTGLITARAAGFAVILDLARVNIPFPYEPVAVSRSFLEENPDAVRRLLRAVVRGTRYFKTHRTEGIEVLRGHLGLEDADALAEIYETYARTLLERPLLPPAGVQIILDELVGTRPEASGANVSDFVDQRIVEGLVASGFIDRVYEDRLDDEPYD